MNCEAFFATLAVKTAGITALTLVNAFPVCDTNSEAEFGVLGSGRHRAIGRLLTGKGDFRVIRPFQTPSGALLFWRQPGIVCAAVVRGGCTFGILAGLL